jgi:hypothetical protein
MKHLAAVVAVIIALGPMGALGCTLFAAGGVIPCDVDTDCGSAQTCVGGFCTATSATGDEGREGEGEGEGDVGGEGEGEGEGDVGGEGEGEGDIGGEGEGEGDDGGEGEGEGEGDVFTGCGDVPTTTWADEAFPFRVPFSLCDDGAPDADVIDLPVLVSFAANPIDFDDIGADGHAVRFIDQRGATPVVLSHERAVFINDLDDTKDRAVFWVKVPRMNPRTERDHVWMYFGGANPADTSTGSGTFSTYNASWHFDENSPITAPEARSVASTLIASNNLASDDALVGRGLDLAGTDAFAVLDDQALNDANRRAAFGIDTSTGSISVVLGPRSGNRGNLSNGTAVFFSDGAAPGSFGFDNRSLHLSVVDTAGGDARAGIGFSLPTNPPRPGPATPTFVLAFGAQLDRDAFSHVLVTWSSTSVRLFVNGSPVGQPVATTVVPVLADFIDIGTSQELGNVLRGRVDELRVGNATRDAAFARAEAKSTTGALTRRGAVEAL